MEKDPYDYGDVSLPEELLNLGDPEVYIREGDTTPDTPKKRHQNWMNKNKQYMFGALALLLMLFVALSALFNSGPDYIVGLVTSYTMPEPGRKQLEELLTAYADDRNGDGWVSVKLQAFSFVPNTTDLATKEEMLRDLQTSLITDECMIFLYDEAALQEVAGEVDGIFQYTDGTAMPAGAEDFENASLPWTECKALAAFAPDPNRLNMWDPQIYLELCEKMRVALRAPDEGIQGDAQVSAYQQASAGFVERLQTGEKPPEKEK